MKEKAVVELSVREILLISLGLIKHDRHSTDIDVITESINLRSKLLEALQDEEKTSR